MGPVSPDNVHETGVSPYEPVPIPYRGRGGAAGGTNSKKYLLTGPDPRFSCPTGALPATIMTTSLNYSRSL